MFYVSDSRPLKERRINEYLLNEPMIAVLLAAANIEWTISRCLLVFSPHPTVEVRERLDQVHGLKRYKEIWKQELQSTDLQFPGLATIIREWDKFCVAFELRHRLIHGRDTCTRNMATNPVSRMLWAAGDLYDFASSRGVDLNAKLKARRRKRAA